MGKADATDAEVAEACRKANIHDVIMSLPQQYQTDIGTGGSQLSGGQKQRMAIARAIVKNPKILILDEATSALDRKSEVEVQSALDKVMNEGGAKLTVIVIAHRLATIRNADVIHYIVTDEVRGSTIAESGTFSELVKLNGHFATMTRLQSCEADDDDSSPGETPAADRDPLVAAKRAVSGDAAAITIEPEEQGLDRQDTLAKRVEKEVESKQIPYLRILKMNRENMWAVILGMLGSLISGGVYPVLALVERNGHTRHQRKRPRRASTLGFPLLRRRGRRHDWLDAADLLRLGRRAADHKAPLQAVSPHPATGSSLLRLARARRRRDGGRALRRLRGRPPALGALHWLQGPDGLQPRRRLCRSHIAARAFRVPQRYHHFLFG